MLSKLHITPGCVLGVKLSIFCIVCSEIQIVWFLCTPEWILKNYSYRQFGFSWRLSQLVIVHIVNVCCRKNRITELRWAREILGHFGGIWPHNKTIWKVLKLKCNAVIILENKHITNWSTIVFSYVAEHSRSSSRTNERLTFTPTDSLHICIIFKNAKHILRERSCQPCLSVQSWFPFVVCFSKVQINVFDDCFRWNFSDLTCDQVFSDAQRKKNNRKRERNIFVVMLLTSHEVVNFTCKCYVVFNC